MLVITKEEAADLVDDGDTLLVGGSGGGHAVPETLMAAVETRFLTEGRPRGITSLHPVGLGDEGERGAGHFAHEGLLKRIICGTYVDSPAIGELAARNLIEAYTLPQGALSQLMREMAAGRPGLLTHVGLHTFVDPRFGGGRQSSTAVEQLIEVVELHDREWLFYKPFHVDVAFLRGTTADEDGNVTMEREAVFGEMLSMAQATKRDGGLVIVQVQRLAKRGTLQPKQVKIPGIVVDAVVVEPDEWQTYETEYSPAYAGELRVPSTHIPQLALTPRKVIARRAALELFPGAICNLGSGVSTGVSLVAAEEGILDDIVLTNEQGLIGGAPAGGNDAGAATNFAAMVDQPYQFDFYDGGGLDVAFLSFAEVGRDGSVNVSRFGGKVIGFGGFVNISQNARKVVFGGTLTAGGLDVGFRDGAVEIVEEGRHRKFRDEVEQVSYSGPQGRRHEQEVVYVTERAVFYPTPSGLELREIAPGIDVERQVLAQMDFAPLVAPELRLMDARLFFDQPMGIAPEIREHPAKPMHPRLKAMQTREERINDR